jgi:hypothetical protein
MSAHTAARRRTRRIAGARPRPAPGGPAAPVAGGFRAAPRDREQDHDGRHHDPEERDVETQQREGEKRDEYRRHPERERGEDEHRPPGLRRDVARDERAGAEPEVDEEEEEEEPARGAQRREEAEDDEKRREGERKRAERIEFCFRVSQCRPFFERRPNLSLVRALVKN